MVGAQDIYILLGISNYGRKIASIVDAKMYEKVVVTI
jgi:hypothetical protein